MKKYVKLFEEFIGEATKPVLPAPAMEFAKLFNGKWVATYGLNDVYDFEVRGSLLDDIQVTWNNSKSGDYGDYGFQIGDESGDDLYFGTDAKAAKAAVDAEIRRIKKR